MESNVLTRRRNLTSTKRSNAATTRNVKVSNARDMCLHPNQQNKHHEKYNNFSAFDYGQWSTWSQLSESCGKVVILYFFHLCFRYHVRSVVITLETKTGQRVNQSFILWSWCCQAEIVLVVYHAYIRLLKSL